MGVDLTIEEVIRETAGTALGVLEPSARLSRISTDTRLLERNDFFVTLIGKRMDGHDFIEEAMEKGVRLFLVSNQKKIKSEWLKSAGFIRVKDTLAAYGELARHYRSKFKIPLIAITGSSGKTTVKELTAHLLSAKFKVLKNRGTENNLIGVPKTLFQLDEATEVAVLEIGTSLPGEIERLSWMTRPQMGILTQIGYSHLEGLKSLEGVREEKLSLVKNLERGGVLILNAEDSMLQKVKSGVHRVVRVGFDAAHADLAAEDIQFTEQGTRFRLKGHGLLETALLGRHNVLNCLLAIEAALAFGVEFDAIKSKLADFKAIPGRLFLKNIEGIVFLDDSYNSNPTSFQAAVETLKNFKSSGKKGVVCGDMLELGDLSKELHRNAGRWLAEAGFDFVVAVGTDSAYLVEEAIKKDFPKEMIYHAKDSVAAGGICRKLVSQGDVVLVKGSRGMQMEKIFECFINSSTL